MSVAVLSPPQRVAVSPEIVAGLALAAGIAWLQPFDVIFAAATFGQPALRAALIVAVAVAGAGFARRLGLSVTAPPGRSGMLFPVLLAAGVAVACALVDRAFEPMLHPGYVRVVTRQALAVRTLGFMMRAFNENILYRLFLGSALAWLFGRVWRDREGRPAPAALWGGFALSQAINVAANVTLLAPLTALGLLHDALRYFAPGLVWSWLYVRRGFRANEVASTSVHLFFQPLVGLLLG